MYKLKNKVHSDQKLLVNYILQNSPGAHTASDPKGKTAPMPKHQDI
jgi:hypothetical protein